MPSRARAASSQGTEHSDGPDHDTRLGPVCQVEKAPRACSSQVRSGASSVSNFPAAKDPCVIKSLGDYDQRTSLARRCGSSLSVPGVAVSCLKKAGSSRGSLSGVMSACEVVGWYIKPHVAGTCA